MVKSSGLREPEFHGADFVHDSAPSGHAASGTVPGRLREPAIRGRISFPSVHPNLAGPSITGDEILYHPQMVKAMRALRRCMSPLGLQGIALAGILLALPSSSSAAPRKLDLNARIEKECGPPGYRVDSGCRVELGGGTFTISETVRLGSCTATTVRNSVILEGRSAGMLASVPRFPTAGTTLQWKGPEGGTMFEVCGASFLSFRDLTLDAAGAGIGIRMSADNAASAISHFVELRNVVINGAAVGVYVTGRNYADQVDFVTLERVSLSNVGTGYLQDSQQSVVGRLETVEVTARSRGFVIRNGSLSCESCYVGALPPGKASLGDFIAFHLTRGSEPAKPWEAHHQIQIEDSHMELDRGTFIVEDAGAHFPITLIGNSYSLQCSTPGCEMRVVDSNSRAPIVMIGDVIQASSNPPARPKARICHRGPDLIHLGVHKKPEVSELIWGCAQTAQ